VNGRLLKRMEWASDVLPAGDPALEPEEPVPPA